MSSGSYIHRSQPSRPPKNLCLCLSNFHQGANLNFVLSPPTFPTHHRQSERPTGILYQKKLKLENGSISSVEWIANLQSPEMSGGILLTCIVKNTKVKREQLVVTWHNPFSNEMGTDPLKDENQPIPRESGSACFSMKARMGGRHNLGKWVWD